MTGPYISGCWWDEDTNRTILLKGLPHELDWSFDDTHGQIKANIYVLCLVFEFFYMSLRI
jgi:hypothetical protein